tara:strand:- start:350 stop:562 length:213 start_codon:yes stop_codon:yes gene_type:complete
MPEKFKQSEKVRDKKTGKISTRHYYLKNTPLSELERIANNSEARPKLRIKCIKEINRRNALQRNRRDCVS